MRLLCVTLLCVSIHPEIMHRAGNESSEIFEIADEEIMLRKKFSPWRKRSSIAEQKCTKTSEGGVRYHKLTLKEFFSTIEEAVACIRYSTFERDIVCKRWPPNNTLNAIMLVMMQTSYGIENSCSDVDTYESAKWIISTDSLNSLSDTGILFENVLLDADITIILEKYHTDSFTSFFTNSGCLHVYLYLETSRLSLYKNTTIESVCEIEDYVYVLLNDRNCSANIQFESKCSMSCLTLLSLTLGKYIEEEGYYLKTLYGFWVIPLEKNCSNITLMSTDLFDIVWFSDNSSSFLWFEFLLNSMSCEYAIRTILTLDACVNNTELTFSSHILFPERTYFATVYSCGMLKTEGNESYMYLCPVFLLMNDSSETISQYCVSENKFFYRSRMTIACPATISFGEIIFLHNCSSNITMTSNIKYNSSISKGASKDCSFWYNIHHKYMIISDYLNRDEGLQLVYQILKTPSCNSMISVEVLHMDCIKSIRDDERCIDFFVLVVSNYSSFEDIIFCGKLSINNTLDFTVTLMIQNVHINESWHIHSEKRSDTDWTGFSDFLSGLSENGKCFKTTSKVNYFDKLTTFQNTCIIKNKLNSYFNVFQENESLRQSCKFNKFVNKANNLAFKPGEHFCVDITTKKR
ncbi:uncharacterized protein LOC133180671 [Saccostrea echinata]|uniref:uncharacterized protein LOC133180671 n=1 Tax=Saccostrea echinata TaxID=191078 RepID=UPI002A838A96|nr:uncharacterized protein LOC133180671 [Saccostrea echinata]